MGIIASCALIYLDNPTGLMNCCENVGGMYTVGAYVTAKNTKGAVYRYDLPE